MRPAWAGCGRAGSRPVVGGQEIVGPADRRTGRSWDRQIVGTAGPGQPATVRAHWCRGHLGVRTHGAPSAGRRHAGRRRAAPGTRRRAPGLRREELAGPAGISADYLTRPPPGRATTPSTQVTAALARAPRTDGEAPARPYRPAGHAP